MVVMGRLVFADQAFHVEQFALDLAKDGSAILEVKVPVHRSPLSISKAYYLNSLEKSASINLKKGENASSL